MADTPIDGITTQRTITGTEKIPVGDAAGDGVQRYITPTALDAWLQTQGASRIIMSAIGTAAFGLGAVATAQAAFPATQDVLTLAADTTYYFEGRYIIASGATSHATSMLFAAGGGLTIQANGCEYVSYTHAGTANAIVTTSSAKHNSGLGAQSLIAASTAVRTVVTFDGMLRILAGGTLTPQIQFSVNPTGTNQMLPGSWIRLTPFGNGTVTTVGAWA